MKPGAILHILLAEDNANDAEVFRLCLQRARILNEVHLVGDGNEALAYLKGHAPYSDRAVSPLPGLVFLDLNLPGRTGLDVLKELKDDPNLAQIPVVILTISQEENDILQSYQYGSHVYIHKPVDPVNLRDVILGLPGVSVLLAHGEGEAEC